MNSLAPSVISALRDASEEVHSVASGDIRRYAQEYDTQALIDDKTRKLAVNLEALEPFTRCPICFGRIKNTRVSLVCLHRFCGECIDQAIRSCDLPGRPSRAKQCPVCRARLRTRRDAVADPRFDAIMTALYGDVAAYEAAEEARVADVVSQVGSFTRPAAAGGAPAAGAIAAAAGATTTSPTSPTPPTLAAPTPLVGARVEQQHTSEGGQGGSREGRGGEGGLRGRGLKRKASPNDNETSPTPDDVSAMIPNPKKEACIKAGTEAGEEAKERDGARVSNRASPRAVRARTSHVADNNTRLPASKLSITVPCTTPIPTHMTPVRASGAGRGGKRSRLAVACFPRSPADRTTPDLVSATLAPLSPSPSPPTAATSNGALAKVPPASHFALPKKGVPAESQPPKQVSLAVCGRRGLETVRERSGEQAKPLGRQRIDKTHVGPGDNMDAVPRGVRTRPGGKRKGGGRGGGEDTAAASPARPAHGRGRSRASAASGSSQPRRGTQKGAKAGVGGAASVPVPTMLTRAQTLRTRLQVRRARAQAKRV